MRTFEHLLSILHVSLLLSHGTSAVSKHISLEEPSNVFYAGLKLWDELEDAVSSHSWLRNRANGLNAKIPVPLLKSSTFGSGIYFERDFSVFPNETFSLSFNGGRCLHRDKFGDNKCEFRWKDKINVSMDRSIDHILQEGDEYTISIISSLGGIPFYWRNYSCSACSTELPKACTIPSSLLHIHGLPIRIRDCPARTVEHISEQFKIKPQTFNLFPGTVAINVTATVRNGQETKMKLHYYVKMASVFG